MTGSCSGVRTASAPPLVPGDRPRPPGSRRLIRELRGAREGQPGDVLVRTEKGSGPGGRMDHFVPGTAIHARARSLSSASGSCNAEAAMGTGSIVLAACLLG